VGPPAANGTTIVIGRVGKVCAFAIRERAGSENSARGEMQKIAFGGKVSLSPFAYPH